ncbi:hypothetical protein [Actinomadura rifamycini]|uniref:hypothetical protein n=1 Tax=Actinomadura rifamycini TaxID=31962 RepID=UPI000414C0F0|nr:hypothetical protein [Actinomadura rifamycini]
MREKRPAPDAPRTGGDEAHRPAPPDQPWRAEGVPDGGRRWRPGRNTYLFWTLLILVFAVSYASYHESGHGLLGMPQPGADPVRKITIVPHGRALGVTLSTPEDDRYAYDERYLRGRIIGALGGMAAEELVFGVVTTGGSESDLEQVTRIARGMAGRWGMSPAVGPLSVLPADGDAAAGIARTTE